MLVYFLTVIRRVPVTSKVYYGFFGFDVVAYYRKMVIVFVFIIEVVNGSDSDFLVFHFPCSLPNDFTIVSSIFCFGFLRYRLENSDTTNVNSVFCSDW